MTALQEERIHGGKASEIDFCIGFAIKDGVLKPNSCANTVAYADRIDRSDGRELPEETYFSLLRMLNANNVSCDADPNYDAKVT